MLRRALRSVPAALTLTLAVSVVGVLTGTVLRCHDAALIRFAGFDITALDHGRLYTLALGTFLQDKPGIMWTQASFVLFAVAALELSAGTATAATTFFAGDWLTTVATTAMLWLAAHGGSTWAATALARPSVGSSAAAFACVAVWICGQRGAWRVALGGGLIVVVLTAFTYQRPEIALSHAVATTVGGLMGGLSAAMKVASP